MNARPRQWLRDRPLPPYAFLPGVHPHPTRDPGGHSASAAEQAPTPLVAERWRDCEAWLWGVELFEQGFFWEAHEAWEGAWQLAPRESCERELLQGLIQCAAACLKLRQRQLAAFERLALSAAQHLARAIEVTASARVAGLELRAWRTSWLDFASAAHAGRASLEARPELRLTPD